MPDKENTNLTLVSAVIPTHNRPQLVLRAVHSALNQTYANLEIVVVVDGPNPDTVKILQDLQEPRLRIVALAENVGVSEARNIGVRNAKGGWIAFLDDDDEWLPEKTAKQMASLEYAAPSTNLVVCRCINAESTTKEGWPRNFPRPGENWSEYLCCGGGGPGLPTYLVKKHVMIVVPFLKGLSTSEDFYWLLKANVEGQLVIAWLNETLVICHDDAGEKTRTSRQLDWSEFYQCALGWRPLLTPRAFSYCIVTRGLPRIRRARKPACRSIADFLCLLYAVTFVGRLDFRLCVYIAAYSFGDAKTRNRLRISYERMKAKFLRLL